MHLLYSNLGSLEFIKFLNMGMNVEKKIYKFLDNNSNFLYSQDYIYTFL